MRALTYRIHLREPVLVAQPHSGEPNSATSFDYLPGSALRGAVIRSFLHNWSGNDLAADPDARRLFFDGSTRYLNAYPVDPDNIDQPRMLPTPSSWFREKDETADLGTLYDYAIEVANLDRPKGLGLPFCSLRTGQVYLHRPARQINMHNASLNRNRKQAGDSQLYRYDALAADQTFVGAILADEMADLERVEALLDGASLVLGGSHTGGYGHVDVSELTIETEWAEYRQEARPDGYIVVTLLSDALLRRPDGHPADDLSPLITDGQPHDRSYRGARIVGGWNRKWGLPLPQSWALPAGSVFRLPADAIPAVELQTLIERGIGDHRAEGFGRIAVNWHTQRSRSYTETQSDEPRSGPPLDGPSALTAPSRQIARQMATRRLRQVLDQELLRAVKRIGPLRAGSALTASQMARLRTAVRRALVAGSIGPIGEHLDSLTASARDWKNARLEGERPSALDRWVEDKAELAKDEMRFREYFGLVDQPTAVAGIEPPVDETIRVEYAARLIDTVMQREIRRRRE